MSCFDPLQEGFHRLYGRDVSPPDAAGQIMQTEIAKRLSVHSSSDCRGLHSFRPVRAIPRTKARWKNKKINAAGIIPMTAIAMIS